MLTSSATHPLHAPAARSASPASWSFVPRLRLHAERLLVDRGVGDRPEYREQSVPVLSLFFDYPEGTRRPVRDDDLLGGSFDEQRLDPSEDSIDRTAGVRLGLQRCSRPSAPPR